MNLREQAYLDSLPPEERDAYIKRQAEAKRLGSESRARIAQGVVAEGATKVILPTRPKELTERQQGIHFIAAQMLRQGGNTDGAKETLERAGVEVRVVDSSKPAPQKERKSPLGGMSIEQITAIGEVEVPELDDEEEAEDDFDIWDDEGEE